MRFSPLLAALDADHDGTISASEIANASKSLLTLDKDGDGKISRAEGSALPYFQAADKNNDGFLTLEEVQNYFRSRRSSGTNPK